MASPSTATVIEMPQPPRKTSQKVEAKWGKNVWALGFNSIPAILFHGQQRLGLSRTQMCLILQLADFWWDAIMVNIRAMIGRNW